MKEVTLLVDGLKMTFSEEWLATIVKEHFKKRTTEIARTPTVGKCFLVDPNSIDQTLFMEKKIDVKQEKTRQIILNALKEAQKNPKYTKPFKTIIPEKTWNTATYDRIVEISKKYGPNSCMADGIQQALEWAQRIQNGESWKDVCNEYDFQPCFRLVQWQHGQLKIVGGSVEAHDFSSATELRGAKFNSYEQIKDIVPLVAVYDN